MREREREREAESLPVFLGKAERRGFVYGRRKRE